MFAEEQLHMLSNWKKGDFNSYGNKEGGCVTPFPFKICIEFNTTL